MTKLILPSILAILVMHTFSQEPPVAELKQKAEQGSPDAQYNLGLTYERGEGVSQDQTEAILWFRLAAEQGVAEAQYKLGHRFAEGYGVPQGYAEAVKWYQAASEQGLAAAQIRLGLLHANGEGVPKDFVQAYKWFELTIADIQFVNRARAMRGRDEIAKRMTPEQVAEAQRLASDWKPKTWEFIQQELMIGLPE